MNTWYDSIFFSTEDTFKRIEFAHIRKSYKGALDLKPNQPKSAIKSAK